MFVKHLTNQRGHAQGTVVWCGHGGVRDIMLRQGIVELVPDPNAKKEPDGNPDSNTDGAAPDVDGGNVATSEAPSEVVERPKRVRRRAKASDSDGSTDDPG